MDYSKNMPPHLVELLSKVAACVHDKTRMAIVPPEDVLSEKADARDTVYAMLGSMAGFYSAAISTISDLHETGMIDDEAHARLYDKAYDLCKDVQVELQKQIARDLAEAGADIDLSKLETAHEDAVALSDEEVTAALTGKPKTVH